MGVYLRCPDYIMEYVYLIYILYLWCICTSKLKGTLGFYVAPGFLKCVNNTGSSFGREPTRTIPVCVWRVESQERPCVPCWEQVLMFEIMGRKVYKAYSCIHVCSFRSGDHGQNSKPFVACADSADGGRLKREPCDKQWTPFWTYMERFPEYCTSNPPWKHV